MAGHDWRFAAVDRDLTWSCARCGEPGGVKRYERPQDAARYARAFEAERDREGRRFHVGTSPLWVWRRLRGR